MNEEVLTAKFEAAEGARKRERNDEAIRLYGEVVEHSSGPLRQRAMQMLGVSLSQNDNQAGAIRTLADLLSERLDDALLGNVRRDYGNALSKAKRYDEAARQFDQSLDLLLKVGDRVGVAATHYFQARNLFRQGQAAAALKLAEQAAGELAPLDAPEVKLYCDLCLARLYAANHQPEEARELAERAEKAAEVYGGEAHVTRAKLIAELAERPEELEKRLAEKPQA